MEFLINGNKVIYLKKQEEFYIKTDDGREIVATKHETMDTIGWAFKGGDLSRSEINELTEFLTNINEE